MNVAQVIELLQAEDPSSEVLIEGAAETFWSIKHVSADENEVAVILMPGDEREVRGDD